LNGQEKHGCTLLHFSYVYDDFIWWLEGECTDSTVVYDTLFNNLEDLYTFEMPPGYPQVDLNQTWETLKEAAPTKGNLVYNFKHVRQREIYDNHQGMYNT
jgi:hypothetical protein